MRSTRTTRRCFLAGTAALAAGSAWMPACVTAAQKRTAADRVTLGKTGLNLSRLGMGLGSKSGNVQWSLGQAEFTRLVHYAFDHGIRYFDCAQSYKTFDWLSEAIKGLPREELFLISKIGGNPEKPEAVIDRHLKTFRTDYIDCMLLHCAVTPTWPKERGRLMEAIETAQANGKIRAKGISCHSLPALRVAASSEWVEVNLVRVNPQARHTDTEAQKWDAPGIAIDPVIEQLKVMKHHNHGVIGMKLVGDGDFKNPEDREKAMRFAMAQPEIDAVVIGFKSTAEIDESIWRMNNALAGTPSV